MTRILWHRHIAFCLIAMLSSLGARQAEAVPDAVQAVLQQQHASAWKKEDDKIERSLATLHKRFGKRPNIIVILSDDIGWGEIGAYGGGKLRGAPTPAIDALGVGGMKFLTHYAEPSCTPTRVALMTGRHPLRTGLDEVLFPGQSKGLVAEEVTLAEVLSSSGYHTAMFGKWHLGEAAESQPHQQGFDYALYNLYNGSVWPWQENAKHYDKEVIDGAPYFLDIPEDYEQRYNTPLPGIMEAEKGGKAHEIAPLSLKKFNSYDDELTDKVIEFVGEKARSDKPFFVYYATNTQQVFACPDVKAEHLDRSNCQARQLVQHDANVARLMARLKQLKIQENTLVLWISDNGPMDAFYPSTGFSWLRGHKNQVYEGGVRTPSFAYWPGMIKAQQQPVDIVHVSDWYTTVARLAGAGEYIPDDRVIDGVDQRSLLFNGEGHSRRNYVYFYRYVAYKNLLSKGPGSILAAVRMNDIKFHINTGETYNLLRDPTESVSIRKQYLWAMQPLRHLIREHQDLMQQYPNRVLMERGRSGTHTMQ